MARPFAGLIAAALLVAVGGLEAAPLMARTIGIHTLDGQLMDPAPFSGQGLSVTLPLGSGFALGESWRLQPLAGFVAQKLHSGGENGELYSTSASLLAQPRNSAFGVELGTGPGRVAPFLINRRRLGGHFQMSSHLSLHFQVLPRLALQYRYQHTSNGRAYDFNQGLDFHLLGVLTAF